MGELDRSDVLCVLALLAILFVYATRYYDFSRPPAEDAAMLMRYSQHLAQGNGIVWNVGEKPVDGATDFLFMVVVAGFARLGMPVETAVLAVGLVSHVLTVLLIFVSARTLFGAPNWLAFFPSLYLAVGPAMSYIAARFGTPFFALSAAITWLFAYKYVLSPHARTALFIAISGVIMGLIRPEGVLLAGFMAMAIVFWRGVKESRRFLLYFVIVLAVIGGAYFFWRWGYFGYPLPNPFYKKGGGELYWSGLSASINNTIALSLPFIWIFPLSLAARTTKQAIFALIPVTGFSAIWILLSNEADYLGRFQYAVLPIVLISWIPLVMRVSENWKLPKFNDLERYNRILLIGLAFGAMCSVILYRHRSNDFSRLGDSRYEIARILSQYKNGTFTLATSEAGLLPFYSNWRAVDAWGLNDQFIAHNGGLTYEYLDQFKPDLIMFHTGYSPIVPIPNSSDSWSLMVLVLKHYAERNGYTLAAAYGVNPYDTHYYYVSPSFPDAVGLIEKIRQQDYFWGSRLKSLNYALPVLPNPGSVSGN